jgi:tetratricopeptide (TPR) repeat protein|tara:strand:- start:900 stop:1667 length:768 start_codon:yes stop_codon:yes gene_type:complete
MGDITAKEILEKLKENHQLYQYAEDVAWGRVDPGELTEDDLNNIVIHVLDELLDIHKLILDCKELDNYWVGHINCFLGYTHGRAHFHDKAQKYFLKGYEIYSSYEKTNPYPSDFPFDDIDEYADGDGYFSLMAYSGYAGALSFESGKKSAAGKAYLNGIKLAKSNYPELNYWISEMYRKAGEFFSSDKPNEALKLFKNAISSLEKDTDLKTSIAEGDISLLRLKGFYAHQLEICGRNKDSEEIMKEIEPYEDLIT